VEVYLSRPEKSYSGVTMHQLNILNKMHINLQNAEDLQSVGEASLIIDEIIGYSLKGEPHGFAADMII